MKTRNLLLGAGLALLALNANANVWRVNNNSNYDGSSKWGDNFGGTASKPVFKQVNDAVGWVNVKDGDTLQVEGSSNIYDAATLTKKLVVIGPGYYLNENPQASTNALSANISSVVFNEGSDGSQLIGINNVNVSPHDITINVSNIVIKRCRIEEQINLGGTGISNISILENFFSGSETNSILYSNSPHILPTDFYFNNNICQKTLLWDGVINQCDNNTFDGPANNQIINITASEFKNNILKSLNATVNINNNTNNNVTYCIDPAGQFGNGTGNKTVTNINSIFVTSGSTDGAYQIKNGSVADNSGSDSTDRGAFGGAPQNSYTLSGLAPIPVIYQITTTGVAGPQGLPVTIKARTIK